VLSAYKRGYDIVSFDTIYYIAASCSYLKMPRCRTVRAYILTEALEVIGYRLIIALRLLHLRNFPGLGMHLSSVQVCRLCEAIKFQNPFVNIICSLNKLHAKGDVRIMGLIIRKKLFFSLILWTIYSRFKKFNDCEHDCEMTDF